MEDQVLHFDGHEWTCEPIEIPTASKEEFRVLGIAATGPTNAWLLAQLSSKASYPAGAVALFRRVREGEGEKREMGVEAGHGHRQSRRSGTADGPGAGGRDARAVHARRSGRAADGDLPDPDRDERRRVGRRRARRRHTRTPASTTIYFKPEGEAGEAAAVEASWCLLPAGAEGAPPCQHELPEALPGGYRSLDRLERVGSRPAGGSARA